MGKIVKSNLPCKDQVECCSSDARRLYENGSSFCFSCQKPFSADPDEVLQYSHLITGSPTMSSPNKLTAPVITRSKYHTLEEVNSYPVRGLRERNITKVVTEFFDMRVSFNGDGEIDGHFYPYITDGKLGYKHRTVATKQFDWIGTPGDLFGMDKFPGGGKRLIITEGEIDAMAVAQASMDKYEKIYPVVSVTSATGIEKLLVHREWIRSFDEVCIWFDNDERGKEALDKALKIIGVDKAKIVTSPNECKDASDVLIKSGWKAVMTSIWDAERWVPAGIILKDALWEALCNYNDLASISYPPCMAGANSKLKGLRLGEIALFISGTGSGKSTLLREIMLHLLEHADVPITDKIGVISLEEAPAETARKLAGMALYRNPADEEIPIEELKVGFDKVFGADRVMLLDHQGSIADGSIVNQLEYMALMGCKYLFIDHITILVSEGADGLTGNEAIDKVMNDLLRLVKRHGVWIGLVSHLRKAPVGKESFEEGKLPTLDDIRGSGSIKQISFDVLAFARNMQATDEREKNTIKMAVLKCRYTGLTGIVSGAYYDNKTGRLTHVMEMPTEDFTKIE